MAYIKGHQTFFGESYDSKYVMLCGKHNYAIVVEKQQ